MKTLDEMKTILAEHKEELKEKYNVKEIGIFGSYVQGEQNIRSDMDILVEFSGLPDVFILIDLEDYLETLLEKKIDLVRKAAIRHELREIILKEVVYI